MIENLKLAATFLVMRIFLDRHIPEEQRFESIFKFTLDVIESQTYYEICLISPNYPISTQVTLAPTTYPACICIQLLYL